MNKEQVATQLKEEIICLYNETNDADTKEFLKSILNSINIHLVKCPNCGNKFNPMNNLKTWSNLF